MPSAASRRAPRAILPSPSERQHLTLRETAARLRLTEGTVRAWVRLGRLPAIRLGPAPTGRLLVPLKAVDDLLRGEAVRDG